MQMEITSMSVKPSVQKAISISITAVPKFDELPIDLAVQLIYDRVVSICEEKKIRLSWEGNHSALGKKGVEAYDRKKEQHTLFNVETVQLAFANVDDLLIPAENTGCDSLDLSQTLTDHCKDKVHQGDLIVAMLLKGYSAYFREGHKDKNPSFQVSYFK
jgi:hypothetical protein